MRQRLLSIVAFSSCLARCISLNRFGGKTWLDKEADCWIIHLRWRLVQFTDLSKQVSPIFTYTSRACSRQHFYFQWHQDSWASACLSLASPCCDLWEAYLTRQQQNKRSMPLPCTRRQKVIRTVRANNYYVTMLYNCIIRVELQVCRPT